jgi:hypothetical protein
VKHWCIKKYECTHWVADASQRVSLGVTTHQLLLLLVVVVVVWPNMACRLRHISSWARRGMTSTTADGSSPTVHCMQRQWLLAPAAFTCLFLLLLLLWLLWLLLLCA